MVADDARSAIFGAITRAAARTPAEQDAAHRAVADRLARHPRNLVPARGQLPPAERLALFTRMAEGVAATVRHLSGPADVPGAVADYLSGHNLPARARVAPDAALRSLPWDSRPTLEVAFGPAGPADRVTVTRALAGVAETGSCLMTSGPDGGPTLIFLPETNIIVLASDAVTGSYEEAWDMLRRRQGDRGMPRIATLVTGPSRTADIEQTPQVHAHGPGHLHILLVDGLDPPGPPAS